jgi:DinB family protein
MTHYVPYAILAVMLAATAFAQEPKAFHYLNETRDGLISAVKGLSEAQWNFKPAPDRWSVAEIVEHLALVEGFAKSVLDKMPQAPPPADGFNAAEVDAMILAKVPIRSPRYTAPSGAQPTGRWTPGEALEIFVATRRHVAEALHDTAELRRHTVPHPALGPLDGYEWVLAAAAHSLRHTGQIQEVKADPHFPR